MDLNTRLEILQQGGQLCPENHARILQVITWFSTQQSIELTEDNAAPLITHLCGVLERIKKGEPVLVLDDAVYESAKEDPVFASANAIAGELAQLLPELPDAERRYLIIHIGTLLAGIPPEKE